MRSCEPLAVTPPALGRATEREPHLNASLARLVVELLDERGHRASESVPVHDANARIPESSLASLLESARRLLDDENVGLHAGQRADAGRLGLFGLLLLTAATPRALASVAGRFSRVLHDEAVFDLRERGPHAMFTYGCADGQRQSVELVIAAVVACARQNWPSCPVEAVFFAHAAPSSSTEHTSFFRAPVQFDAAFNGYAISAGHLDALAISADSGLHAALIEHAGRVLDSLDFVAAVRHAVGRGLLLGHSGAPWVASELRISSRTLHRRLQEKSVRYSAIVDDERSRRARTQLAALERVAEVAHQLGFASPGAFRKAFKRWTGLTPAEFKRRSHAQ